MGQIRSRFEGLGIGLMMLDALGVRDSSVDVERVVDADSCFHTGVCGRVGYGKNLDVVAGSGTPGGRLFVS